MILAKRCLLPPRVLVLCLIAISWSTATLRAQDRLVFKDNHVQEGKVVGMSGPSVLVNVITATGAPGQISFNLGLLTRIEAAPPAAYHSGVAAYNAADWDKALATLKPIADQFRGLPTPWAQHTTALLGDIYLEKNDPNRAEAAYNDFRKFYPSAGGNSVRYNLGQARIAFVRNNFAQAKQGLEPIIAQALKNPADANRGDAAAYGQAFYLRGQLRERDGDTQAALEDYLRTVTLFYQDGATTARAQKSVDSLRAAHKDLVAP